MKKVFKFFFELFFADSGNVFYNSQERRGDESGYSTRTEAEDAASKKAAREGYEISKKTDTNTEVAFRVFRRKVLPILLIIGLLWYLFS